MAGFFAVAAVLALGFMGSMVQSNSIGEAVNTATGIDPWIVGVVVAAASLIFFLLKVYLPCKEMLVDVPLEIKK